VTKTAPDKPDLALTGRPVSTTVLSSLGIVALALAAAFVVVTLRRRRTRLAGVAAPPDSPPAAE
jgi:LPXTG-motif cell wall-anchored protein